MKDTITITYPGGKRERTRRSVSDHLKAELDLATKDADRTLSDVEDIVEMTGPDVYDGFGQALRDRAESLLAAVMRRLEIVTATVEAAERANITVPESAPADLNYIHRVIEDIRDVLDPKE